MSGSPDLQLCHPGHIMIVTNDSDFVCLTSFYSQGYYPTYLSKENEKERESVLELIGDFHVCLKSVLSSKSRQFFPPYNPPWTLTLTWQLYHPWSVISTGCSTSLHSSESAAFWTWRTLETLVSTSFLFSLIKSFMVITLTRWLVV